jgi:Flp pilus assembly protein TadD
VRLIICYVPDLAGMASARQHLKAGTDHHSRGRRADAEAAYREAIRLSPRDYHPHFGLGNLLCLLRRYAEAEAPYREALRLVPI